MSPMNYAAAASYKTSQAAMTTRPSVQAGPALHHGNPDRSGSAQEQPIQRRTPSPTCRPKTLTTDDDVYVLTFLTDKPHHDRMTGLRNKYFPPHRNKLEAHLTLFHALPQSKLDSSIIPVIETITQQNEPFAIHIVNPFRLRAGIALAVSKEHGGLSAQQIHRALQKPWNKEGFLSDQDSGGFRAHYTIMNKVEDPAKVDEAFAELQSTWNGTDIGSVEGLALWKYDRGWWRAMRKFEFKKAGKQEE